MARPEKVEVCYVQVAPVASDAQRWYTVAALINVGVADWLAAALQIQGQRGVRVVDHDELLELGGELAIGMAHNDLVSLDPELLGDPVAGSSDGRA